jgi:hypothetical protein
MKIPYFVILFTANADRIIKNIHIPSCKNCIYYQPNHLQHEFSSLNKCAKFDEKYIVNGVIKYEYAESCRENESKCGKEGNYYIEDTNFIMQRLKIVKNVLIENAPFISLAVLVVTYIWLLTVLPKLYIGDINEIGGYEYK